ncbi:hypothetical protein QJS10_CPA02g00728 [Acorus calamus]|uniref:Uncharacterized protein n=1 Tax=Acorus calamus TaxID=4465 RepID=A0AAV9FGB3_ACOCL|nr:hypothetical protein QJS10_CPA02g00728 [Acorus calamus]
MASIAQEMGPSLQWEVGDGHSTLFWKDSWCGEGSFMERFPEMFNIALEKDCLVQHYWRNIGGSEGWSIRLSRGPLAVEEGQAQVLAGILRTVALGSSPDQVRWKADSSRCYKARHGYGWFMRHAPINLQKSVNDGRFGARSCLTRSRLSYG